MSAILHIATLCNRQFQLHPASLRQVIVHLDGLDALCKTLGVTPISHFIDLTAVEFEEAAALAGDTNTSSSPDPETGLAYGIEDMEWLPISTGMISFEALISHLQRNRPKELNGAPLTQLVEELQLCETTLAPLEIEGGQFNLSACTPA